MIHNVAPCCLEKQILSMPLDEKIYLLNRLQRNIELEMVCDPDEYQYGRVKALTKAACSVLDLPTMMWNSRISAYVWARAFIAYELYLEGFSEYEIGSMIQRNHSSVNYLKQKMEDVIKMPDIFSDINIFWKQFKELIKQ